MPTGLELSHPEVLRGIFKVVGRLVCVQVRLLVKALVAAWVRAREWLLASMYAHMRLQIEIKRELLAALIALVGLLACVHEHVPLELRVVQEAFFAPRVDALEELVAVDSHVFL